MDADHHLAQALSDRYRIESEIDSGGMATVYRARDLKHERTVAIKVLRPDLAEAIGADRFLREIRTTANLSHPHILPLFDSGEADGFLFYVMPFVEGESLRDRLEREGQLPIEDAVQIAREVAEALAYAHEKGVIHRDIKPANILLERGHALLADFGIAQAKAGADETRLTGMGMSLGTPSYMSPEQISGEGAVDGRADQYALACVLYEMLAGHPPFSGADIQTVMRQHLAADAPKVTGARATVPTGVARAIHRSLAKTPADRFRTVAEFEKALAGATLPLLARIPMGRARAAVYAGTVILGLATAAVIASVWRPGGGAEPGWRPSPQDVAVAPFVNRTGDPNRNDDGWLIAENIRFRLERAEIGKVFTLDEVMRVLGDAGPGADPFTVLSRELGAGIVVTGHFGLQGDTLLISAYCRDAMDGHDLSAIEPARGSVSDEGGVIVQIQDRVAGVLAQHLEPGYVGRDIQRPPLNPEAFRAYLAAWEAQGGPEADLQEAVPLFCRAFELDSTYMQPLIRAWFLITWYNRGPDAERSQERDSLWAILDQSRHLMSRGQSNWIDWVRAEFQQPRNPEQALQTARRQYQSTAGVTAYWLGFSAARQNYLEEALEAFQRWDKGDGEFVEGSVDYNYFYDYAQVLHKLGMHEKELEILQIGESRYPDVPSPENPALKRLELRTWLALGEIDRADSLAAEVPRYDNWMYMVYPALQDYYGHAERARAFLEGEVERFDTDRFYRETPLARAGVLSALGRQQAALEILNPMLAEDPSSQDVLRMIGIAAARVGDTAQAHEIDRRLAEIPYVQMEPWARAFLAAALGERERALGFMKEIPPTQGSWFIFRYGMDFRSLQGWEPYENFMKPKR